MKPIAWRHMMMWGAGSGFILGGLFMLLVFLSYFSVDSAFAVGVPYVASSAHITAVIGMILGMMSGFVVEYSLPLKTSDFNKEKQLKQARKTLPLVFIFNVLVSIPLLNGAIELFSPFMLSELRVVYSEALLVTVAPPIIAGMAAMYAAYRYLFKLRLSAQPSRKVQDIAHKIKRYETTNRLKLEDHMTSRPPTQRRQQQRRNRRE